MLDTSKLVRKAIIQSAKKFGIKVDSTQNAAKLGDKVRKYLEDEGYEFKAACPNCDNDIPDFPRCPFCGAEFEDPAPPPEPEEKTEDDYESEEVPLDMSEVDEPEGETEEAEEVEESEVVPVDDNGNEIDEEIDDDDQQVLNLLDDDEPEEETEDEPEAEPEVEDEPETEEVEEETEESEPEPEEETEVEEVEDNEPEIEEEIIETEPEVVEEKPKAKKKSKKQKPKKKKAAKKTKPKKEKTGIDLSSALVDEIKKHYSAKVKEQGSYYNIKLNKEVLIRVKKTGGTLHISSSDTFDTFRHPEAEVRHYTYEESKKNHSVGRIRMIVKTEKLDVAMKMLKKNIGKINV